MRLGTFFLAGSAVLFSISTNAQPVTGLYVGAGAGVVLREPSTSATGRTRFSTDAGPVGSVSAGWGFGNGLRVEIEGSYRDNDISKIENLRVNGRLLPGSEPEGRENTAAAMANLLYDFDLSRLGTSITPYVGAGIGYGFRQFDHASIDEPLILSLPFNNTARGFGSIDFNGTFGNVAYQAIAGASYSSALPPWFSADR